MISAVNSSSRSTRFAGGWLLICVCLLLPLPSLFGQEEGNADAGANVSAPPAANPANQTAPAPTP
ncbi:MAG: hypothetical protein CMJ46_07965, partial [Planctomyces sp.]|nr:hypothetical protein [Planctomyces sp.]